MKTTVAFGGSLTAAQARKTKTLSKWTEPQDTLLGVSAAGKQRSLLLANLQRTCTDVDQTLLRGISMGVAYHHAGLSIEQRCASSLKMFC